MSAASIRRGLFLSLAVLAALLSACHRVPEELAGAQSEPAAAVRQLVGYLQRDDLAGFARAAVPPTDWQVFEQAWREDRSRWPLSELPLEKQIVPMLATLSAPGSERRLRREFDRQFARQDRDLREAARSLGLFGVEYVKNEPRYNATQRQHYTQVLDALSAWAQQAPLSDPALARNTIQKLAAAARKTGFTRPEQLREAGMEESLRRLSPFFAEAKATCTRYGLPLETTLNDLRTGLVEQEGERALVRIHYPLGDAEIDSQVSLERRDGQWYLSDYLREAERLRAEASRITPARDDPASGATLPASPP